MEENCYLSDFNRGTVDGARWISLSISGMTNLLGYLHQMKQSNENVLWATVLWAEAPC